MKILIILLFYFYCIVFHFCDNNDESAPDLCHEDEPFRTNDRRCHSFSKLCFKTGDDQCNQLLNACKQCPPNNFTMAILRDIRNMSKYQSNLIKLVIDKKIPNTFEQFISTMTNKSNVSSPTLTNNSCAILLVIIIIILFVHFLETRFKLFTKCFQQCINTNHLQYALVKSRKRKYQNENLNETFKSKFQELNENLNETFKSKFQELNDKIDQLQITSKAGIHINSASISNNIKFEIIKFQFDDIDQEPIEMYVHNNHNIVQVKQQICNKLPHAKHDDYKIMRLKYNGIILNDDNQYLLENIYKSNTSVNCFIDSSMNASDIIVVKLQGKMRLPDIIQINKNQTIDQLKDMIGKIINLRDFTLFKEILNSKKQMKKTLLNLNSICIEKELIDGDCIRIVQTVEGKLIITSIFDKEFSIPAAFKNTNQVSSLITFVKSAHNFSPINFVLFCNNQYLEEDKYICEYDICADSPVKICNIISTDGIDKDRKDCEIDFNWKLYHATKTPNSIPILLKEYVNITLENWKSQDWMMNELKTFLLTENHERFIQLVGVYFDDSLYVAMENMEKGTLKNYLEKNKDFERKLICKWSEQILEGLEYLHDRKVVHRDLNPSNILVNVNIDLKLSSFNLSKYENIYGPASFYGNNDLSEALEVRYMAPELWSGGKYEFQCDIWSFGTVLVRIASGKNPLPRLSKEEVKVNIINNGTVDYELSDKYKSETKLKSLIDSCLKVNPDERCTIEKLKEMKNFISD